MMHYTQDLVQQLRPYFQSSAKLKSLLLKFGLTGTAVWIIARYFFYRLYLHPVNKIPGPPTDWLPLLGNALQILKADPGACQLEWTKKYGTIVSYHGPWNRPRVLISDPELVKQVLTTQEYDFVKPPETVNFLGNVLGYGVLLAEGAEHKHQRKMLNPAFSVHALRGMVPAMTVPAVHLRDEWLKLASFRPAKIDVSAGLSLATLDVIGIAGFGTEFRSVTDSELDTIGGRLSRAYRDLFLGEASLMRFIGIFVPTLRKLPTKRNQVLRRDIQTLNEETQRMIEKGRERENVAAGRDLLSLMIRQIDEDTGRGMTTQELKDQCLTFLAAGHETTSVALSWGLYLLAQHQDIQEQLRQEVKQLFQSIDTSLPFFSDFMQAVQDGKLESFVEQANIPSYDAINNLKLLNNVCKETMRLYPPVPMTNRINLKDTTLGHYYIPKGTMLFISPMVSHHDPRWWGSDVEEFRPSRWNEAPANQISPYIYLPFLAGGRQCIGYRFALMEFKVLISILILNLKFSLVPGFKPRQKQQITLRSYPALELMVEKI